MSKTWEGTSTESDTVLPMPPGCSESTKRLSSGLVPVWSLARVAEHIGRFVVFGFGRNHRLDAAVDVAAHRKPGNRRNLAGDDIRKLRMLADRIKASDDPRVAALQPADVRHEILVGRRAAAAARVQVDGLLHEGCAPERGEAGFDERQRCR